MEILNRRGLGIRYCNFMGPLQLLEKVKCCYDVLEQSRVHVRKKILKIGFCLFIIFHEISFSLFFFQPPFEENGVASPIDGQKFNVGGGSPASSSLGTSIDSAMVTATNTFVAKNRFLSGDHVNANNQSALLRRQLFAIGELESRKKIWEAGTEDPFLKILKLGNNNNITCNFEYNLIII